MDTYERGWQRVTDHFCHGEFPPTYREAVLGREALQQCRLSKCNAAIFIGMEEPPFGRVDTSSGDRGGNPIPTHPAVDILESIALLMAPKLSARAEVLSATAVLRDLSDEILDARGPRLGKIVDRVSRVTRRIEPGDCLADGNLFIDRLSEGQRTAKSSQEDQSASALGHSVVGGVHHISGDGISQPS